MFQNVTEVIAAFLGSLSFSAVFQVDKRHYFYCGLAGALAWTVYLSMHFFLRSEFMAYFLATLSLTVFARFLSPRLRAATTVFLIGGIFVLVPGSGVYFTAHNILLGNGKEALAIGKETIGIVLAISMGIAVGYALPPRLFGWGKK